MKKTLLIFIIICALTGCDYREEPFAEEERSFIESDLFINYPNLDESLKSKIRELRLLWSKFESRKSDDIDPTEDFHNSDYIKKLKDLLGQRESLDVSQHALTLLLDQNGLESVDRKILVGKKEFNIRVIGYNVDLYVKAITDIVDVRNKWIFVQCWNEDAFYFTTVSDGGVNTVTDFFPLEIDNALHIILKGYASTSYPQPPFLWSWRLEEEGFYPSDLFKFSSVETDKYFIYDHVNLGNSYCKQKWTFYTDGSYLFVEKRSSAEGSDLWPSDYLNVHCEKNEENGIFSFISIDRDGIEESSIQLVLVNDLFVIE